MHFRLVSENLNGLMKALGLTERIDDVNVWELIMPDKKSLDRLRRVSIRIRSWFAELSFEQRRFIELVILVVEKIRSRLLLKLLAPLILKLLNAILKRAAMGAIALIGEAAYRKMRDSARKICMIARSWGNYSATEWSEDKGFIKYLTITKLYSPIV